MLTLWIAPALALLGAALPPSGDEKLPEGALVQLGSWRLRHRDPVYFVEFGSKGLLSGGMEGEVRLWSLQDGSPLAVEASSEGAYIDGTFDDQGRAILVRGDGRLFAGAIGTEGRLLEPSDLGGRVAVSPDGAIVCVTGRDSLVRLLDVATGDVQHEVELGELMTGRADFSPDGSHVVVVGFNRNKFLRRKGSEDQAASALVVIEVATGDVARRFDSTTRFIHDAVFTPDGAEVLAVDDLGGMRIWRVQDGGLRRAWEPEIQSNARAVAVSPDGEIAALARDDGLLITVRLSDGELVSQRVASPRALGDVSISDDGSIIAVASGTEILLFERDTLEPREARFRHAGPVSAISWSSDGKEIVTGSYDRTMRVWDAETGAGLHRFEANDGFVYGVARGADMFAAGGQDGRVRIFGLDGKSRVDLLVHSAACTALALSPDGGTLASVGADQVLQLLEPDSGTPRFALGGLAGLQFKLAWSPDGSEVAVGATDIAIVSAEDGQRVRTIPRIGAPITALAWSHDGRTLAVGLADKSLRLVDLEGEPTRFLHGHPGRLSAAAFSPDGLRLASASANDKGIRLWDVVEGKEIGRLEGYTREVIALAWSPDGSRLAGGSMDGMSLIWDVATGD